MVKNILIDFGGVLYGIDPVQAFNAFAKISDNPKAVNSFNLNNYTDFHLFLDYESGNISTEYFIDQLKNIFSLGNDNEIIIKAWNSLLVSLHPEAVSVIQTLSKEYNIYLLSNTNKLHFECFKQECIELFSYFSGLFLSYELKDRKPNSSIFEKTLLLSGMKAEETIFIDDSIENINTAKTLKFQTILFQGFNKLSDILHSVKTYSQQN